MPEKRKLSDLTAPELSEEPPAMSTRLKRPRTDTPSNPEHQSITKSIEIKDSNDTMTASGTMKRARRSKKKAAIAAEQSMPTPSLTPSPTPPEVEQPLPTKKMIRKRNTAKAVSPSPAISDTDKAVAPSLTSTPNSTLPQSQQQHASSQVITRKRKASSPHSTHLESDSTLTPSLTSPPAEQQQPRAKKQKMSPKRTTAEFISPDSVEPDSDRIWAPVLSPAELNQQALRTTKQSTTRKRTTAKLASPDSANLGSDKNLAPVRLGQQASRTIKQKATRKRAAKAVPASSPIASSETEDVTLMSPAGRVAKFWMDECRKVFPEKDGYEVTLHSLGDTGDQSKQQVFVWEKEFYDEAMLSGPSPNIPESKYDPSEEFKLPEPSMKCADGSRTWTEKDCDFLQTGTVQAPATMKEYSRAAKQMETEFEFRDVPILVIECRGADADNVYEWRTPSENGLSRSYAQPPQSQIQKALIEKIYTFDDIRVKYEPTKGWLTQEQCFCATAIGDKIKFWKHVSPYPHLKAVTGMLDKAVDEEMFNDFVSETLDEVKEDGFEFAMEWDGRRTFANA